MLTTSKIQNEQQQRQKKRRRRSRSRIRSKVGLNPFFIALILSLYGQAIKPSNSHRAAHPFGIICPLPPPLPLPPSLFLPSYIFCTFLGPFSAVSCFCLLVRLFVFCHKERVDLDSKWKWLRGKGKGEGKGRKRKQSRHERGLLCLQVVSAVWLID